jgi:hypothetical protein
MATWQAAAESALAARTLQSVFAFFPAPFFS